jgi:hypothetical protein
LFCFFEYPTHVFADYAQRNQLNAGKKENRHDQGCESRRAKAVEEFFYGIENRHEYRKDGYAKAEESDQSQRNIAKGDQAIQTEQY